MKQRRILVLADSPTVPTGFGQVSRNVLKEIAKTDRYIIDMVGINYGGHFDRKEFEELYPYLNKLVPAKHPASNDVYGREYVLQILEGRMRELQPPWDVFFTIQDHFVLEAKSSVSKLGFAESINMMQENTLKSEKNRKYHFTWVGYYPVDGKLKDNWVSNGIGRAQFPVAYCNYGYNEIMKFDTDKLNLKTRLRLIKHGTNTNDFYPIEGKKRDDLRKQYFGNLIKPNTHLIVNVNRNQIRKDFLRTLQVYKKFKERVPNSFLYVHCNPNDVGGNIFDMARMIGLDEGDFGVPVNFVEHYGVPISTVNKLYACSDAVITTTLGEGWGLSITEAMATKKPIFAPNITSIPEMLNTEKGFDPDTARGFVFGAGKTDSQMVCFGLQDNEVVRPITDVDEATDMLYWSYKNPKKTTEIVERAYKWASELTWESECKKWVQVFDEACEYNDRLIANGKIKAVGEDNNGNKYAIDKKIKKIGRNDLCPLCEQDGIKIKIKKCKLHKDVFLK